MKRKPKWIKAKLPSEKEFGNIRRLLRKQNLHTICEEAFCPNCTECWESGTATFLLMGPFCTRSCKFCNVQTRNPHQSLDPKEPENLARAVEELGLKYVVLTSVTRDDLIDGGSEHLSRCIRSIKRKNPNIIIEILIPDFQGNLTALQRLIESNPNVVGHNIETTEVLTPRVRDKKASFNQSIQILKHIKKLNPHILTKSSIILGFGETDDQILSTLEELRRVKVDIVTLGQYLQPSRRQLDVVEFLKPEKFDFWKNKALEMGFLYVVSGPLVRSSYCAGEFYSKKVLNENFIVR
ncbi:MAG: lipoyl synthase [Promethearchaeota archaeon]